MSNTPIKWSQEFSVGDAILDAQHRKLLGLCAKLQECLELRSAEGDELFHAVLNDLSEYARQHFVSEERILMLANYPGLAEQAEEHQKYQDEVLGFTLAACDGSLQKAELLEFLSGWWMGHILGSDMEYKPHLQAFYASAQSD